MNDRNKGTLNLGGVYNKGKYNKTIGGKKIRRKETWKGRDLKIDDTMVLLIGYNSFRSEVRALLWRPSCPGSSTGNLVESCR